MLTLFSLKLTKYDILQKVIELSFLYFSPQVISESQLLRLTKRLVGWTRIFDYLNIHLIPRLTY